MGGVRERRIRALTAFLILEAEVCHSRQPASHVAHEARLLAHQISIYLVSWQSLH